jgi:pilus assembly protein CpaF
MQAHGFPDINEAFFDPKTYGLPPPPNIFAETLKLVWAPSLKHREENLPDPAEVKELVARSAERAVEREKELAEKVKAKSYLDGYDFSTEHAEKEHAGEVPEATTSVAEPATAVLFPDPATALHEPLEEIASPETPRAATPGPETLRRALPPATIPPVGPAAEAVETTKRAGAAPAPKTQAATGREGSRPTTQPGARAAGAPGAATLGDAASRMAASNGPRPPDSARSPVQTQARPVGPPTGTSAEPVHRPPPPRAAIQSSNLPPGKRPLPARRSATPAEPAPEEDDEGEPPPASGARTMIRDMPDRFRK